MKKFYLKKSLALVAFMLLGGTSSVWATDIVVPTPVYFNDFETVNDKTATGSYGTVGKLDATIQGSGSFSSEGGVYGKVFTNVGGAARTNYLLLPDDVLSHSSGTKELTIGFWVNCLSTATDYYWAPMFTAYGAAPSANSNTTPMLWCGGCKLLQYNVGGDNWCDFTYSQNNNPYSQGADDNSKNNASSVWLDDHLWHYYTVTFTRTSAKIYIDGVLANSWTLDNSTVGQKMDPLFTAGTLDYICLGGNQRWNGTGSFDNDPAFKFDDIAIYDRALTEAQIHQIRATKLGTGIKAFTLADGQAQRVTFSNASKGTNAWENLMFNIYNNGNKVAAVRADWYDDIASDGDQNTRFNNKRYVHSYNGGVSAGNNVWTSFTADMTGFDCDFTVSYTGGTVYVIGTMKKGEHIYYVNYSKGDLTDNVDFYLFGNNATLSNIINFSTAVNTAWVEPGRVTGTISASGYTSLASANGLNFAGISGLKAYVVTDITKETITLNSVDEIPANSGVVLKGTAGTAYSIPVKSDATYNGTNKLHAAVAATDITANQAYILQGGKFCLVTADSQVPAGKAYLLASDVPTLANILSFSFDDETTAIKTIDAESQNGKFFNLQGQSVNSPKNGLYIVNGKKVIIK